MERTAPPLTARAGDYWRSGAEGILRIAQCDACQWYIHPPMPICPKCQGRSIAFQPVSGKATVYAWTINRYQWSPDMEPPYIMAEVELVEQPGLRIMTNIIGCTLDEIKTGMPVSVTFEQAEDTWIPVFTA
jgi:uncharacterized OB-fold protein